MDPLGTDRRPHVPFGFLCKDVPQACTVINELRVLRQITSSAEAQLSQAEAQLKRDAAQEGYSRSQAVRYSELFRNLPCPDVARAAAVTLEEYAEAGS